MVCLADHTTSNLLKAVFQKFYFVHSWILCPICSETAFSDSVNWMFNFERAVVKRFILFSGSDLKK